MCFLAFLWKQRENFYLNTSNKTDGLSQCILPCGSNTVCAYRAEQGRDSAVPPQ